MKNRTEKYWHYYFLVNEVIVCLFSDGNEAAIFESDTCLMYTCHDETLFPPFFSTVQRFNYCLPCCNDGNVFMILRNIGLKKGAKQSVTIG